MAVKKQQKTYKKPLISVIIPAYKAEKFVKKNLLNVKNVLDQAGYPYEIICVVDGGEDKTYDIAKKLSTKYVDNIRVYGYSQNLGKGHAIRYGMAKAKGDIIGFIDAGIELNPNGLMMLLLHFEWYDADVIVGSKRHPASKVVYPWQRRILSLGYQLIVRLLFGLKIKDTQVGMKFFKREVLERVLPRVLVKEFAIDVEMLSVANYLGFKRIYEAPIELKMKFAGGVSTIASKGFLNTVFKTFWDTAAVFYRLRILSFYDYKNRKNWPTQDHLKLNKM